MCAYRYVAERTCGGGSQPASLRVGWNLSGRLELCLVHAMVLRGTTHSKARIKIIVNKTCAYRYVAARTCGGRKQSIGVAYRVAKYLDQNMT